MAAILGVLSAGVLAGVVIGAVLSLGWLIYVATQPPMPLLGREAGTEVFRDLAEHPDDETAPGIAVLRIDGGLFFATAEALEDRVRGLVEDGARPRALVLDLEGVNFVDSQGSAKIAEIHQLTEADDVTLRLARVKPQVLRVLETDGVVDLIGTDRIHGNVSRAVGRTAHRRSSRVMTEAPEPEPAVARAAKHVFFGVEGGVASTVYGTIVVMATLTAAYATQKHPWKLAGIVVSAAVVLWFAHIYAHGLSESIVRSRQLTRDEVRALFGRELGILLAAVAPATALVLGALGVFRETTAVWLALGAGLVTLAAEGVRFARLEHLGTARTIAATGLNLALGLLVVALKVLVAH